MTHFLCNTHSLDGTIFLPNHAGGAIYQKKAIESIFGHESYLNPGTGFLKSLNLSWPPKNTIVEVSNDHEDDEFHWEEHKSPS